MAHPKERRTQVRTLYCHGKTLEDAAAEAGVSPATARKWRSVARKGGDDWGKARAASLMAGSGKNDVVRAILEQFLLAHQTAIGEVATKDMDPEIRVKSLAMLSDAFHKTTSSLARIDPGLANLGQSQVVLEKMADFIQKKFPHHTQAFLEILEPFSVWLSEPNA